MSTEPLPSLFSSISDSENSNTIIDTSEGGLHLEHEHDEREENVVEAMVRGQICFTHTLLSLKEGFEPRAGQSRNDDSSSTVHRDSAFPSHRTPARSHPFKGSTNDGSRHARCPQA